MSFATNDSATKHSAGVAITAEEIASGEQKASEETARYALYLGDDALMLGQRLSWWISRAPELEEDIALGNIALDLVGHARFLLSYAGTAWGKSEDELAYFRDEEEFRSVTARHFGDGQVHYARLGLTPEASDADVKRAFRQLAATHHPDRVANLGKGAVEQASRRFQEIRESYEEILRLRRR